MGKGFSYWLKVRLTRLECSLALNMLEPHQGRIMYVIMILLFLLAVYGVFVFFPPHIRHLGYLAGIVAEEPHPPNL